jgi:hypothetical protein
MRWRLAPAEGGLQALQQQVLRSFTTTGRPPAASALAETAALMAQRLTRCSPGYTPRIFCG